MALFRKESCCSRLGREKKNVVAVPDGPSYLLDLFLLDANWTVSPKRHSKRIQRTSEYELLAYLRKVKPVPTYEALPATLRRVGLPCRNGG
jgi:hypothetical protein